MVTVCSFKDGTMKLFALSVLILALTATAVFPGTCRAESQTGNLVFILDASKSMLNQIRGKTKISVAKEVIIGQIQDLPEGLNVSLVVYGQNLAKGCSDVEELVPLGPLDKRALIARVMRINPEGLTPISYAVQHTAMNLRDTGKEATIILLSDGKETCQDTDPCQLVKDLKKIGIKFIMNVVGFDVVREEERQLECIARAGGGLYFSAGNAKDLSKVMGTLVAKSLEAETVPVETVRIDRAPKLEEREINAGKARIKMVAIPAGSFNMGRMTLMAESDETPLHMVNLDAFWISRTEITQDQYQALMGVNPSYFKGYGSRPVEQVSWYDAVKYCNKLSETAGLQPCYNIQTWECDYSKYGVRLPTEAEWEYACRAGTTTMFYTGDSRSEQDLTGWYRFNSNSTTHPVGQKKPNDWGLYDMYGNVYEWCNDWYHGKYYAKSPNDNPTGPESGSSRVVRGGSWSSEDECRSSYRGRNSPDLTIRSLGFRVCMKFFSSR